MTLRAGIRRHGPAISLAVLVLVTGMTGCGQPPEVTDRPPPGHSGHSPSTTRPDASPPAPQGTPGSTGAQPADDPHARPSWLGTRVLPERPDGLGEVQETPPELVDRRFAPPDAEPIEDGFVSSVEAVPADVLARSTWTDACPVAPEDLRYLRLAFLGFDARTHLGEMIVNETVADDIVEVFRRIYAAGFPIEEMRVIRPDEIDAPPTGDGNVTTAFVCRPTTLGSTWSEHAFGLAVDVNPFHNPYRREDAVIPELASAYLDRDDHRPGMVLSGDAVTRAFADIGWGWGGEWRSLNDWMHFSRSGR